MFQLIFVIKHLPLFIFFLGLLNFSFTFATVDLLGPADLTMKQISLCENPEQYMSSIVVSRKKLNRTFESFSAVITLDTDLDPTVGINVNVAKWGDGGYKPNYLILNDTDVCAFFFKWLGKNMKQLLRDAGRPETCPITKGVMNVDQFLVNYDELPGEMVYGDFKARILYISNINLEEIACIYVTFMSKPKKYQP